MAAVSHAVRRFAICSIVSVLLAAASAGQQERADPVLDVMARELGRIQSALKQQPVPPYFLSYQLTDNRAVQITAAFGALTSSDDHRTRILDVDLRVGDYTLDNTHELRGGFPAMPDFAEQLGRVPVPVEDAPPDALRMALWRETENRYRRAVERLAQVRTNVQVKVEPEDKSPDFSREAAEKFDEPLASFSFDRKLWEEKLRKFTAPFGKHAEIIKAHAHVVAEVETRRYVNSDGSRIRLSSPLYRLNITGSTKADDGMELPLHQTYISFRPEGLPADETVLKDVELLIQRL